MQPGAKLLGCLPLRFVVVHTRCFLCQGVFMKKYLMLLASFTFILSCQEIPTSSPMRSHLLSSSVNRDFRKVQVSLPLHSKKMCEEKKDSRLKSNKTFQEYKPPRYSYTEKKKFIDKINRDILEKNLPTQEQLDSYKKQLLSNPQINSPEMQERYIQACKLVAGGDKKHLCYQIKKKIYGY